MFSKRVRVLAHEIQDVKKHISTDVSDVDKLRIRLQRLEKDREKVSILSRAAKHKMPRHGIDVSYGKPNPHLILRLGFDFIARYYSFDASKNLTKLEAEDYSHVGLDIVSIWESTGQTPMYGYDEGVKEAKEALVLSRKIGQPSNSPIYFAVDFDPTPDQLRNVLYYFKGCCDVLTRDRVGAYGGIKTINALRGKVDYLYQTYAWSNGKWSGHNNIRQYKNGATVAGTSCDLDLAVTADFGQWRIY